MTKFSIFPESFGYFVCFSFLESTKTVDLSLIPLSIIFISVVIDYFSSSVFLAVYIVPVISMPVLYDLYSWTVSLDFPALIETDISYKNLLIMVPYSCFGDVRKKGEYHTIFILLYGKFISGVEVRQKNREYSISK